MIGGIKMQTSELEYSFTGQEIVEQEGYNYYVMCECCKSGFPINLRGNAWFDPYLKGGKYVHKDCLSEKRKKEID